jgi:hypothetical protein
VNAVLHVIVATICTISIVVFGMTGFAYWRLHMRPPASARLDMRLLGWGLPVFVAVSAVGALIGIWSWAVMP